MEMVSLHIRRYKYIPERACLTAFLLVPYNNYKMWVLFNLCC